MIATTAAITKNIQPIQAPIAYKITPMTIAIAAIANLTFQDILSQFFHNHIISNTAKIIKAIPATKSNTVAVAPLNINIVEANPKAIVPKVCPAIPTPYPQRVKLPMASCITGSKSNIQSCNFKAQPSNLSPVGSNPKARALFIT